MESATNRRSILGLFGGMAALTLPAAAQASVHNDWNALISALSVVHPSLGRYAQYARDAGYDHDDLMLVYLPRDGRSEPFLTFRRDDGPTPGPRTFPTHHVSRTEGY